MEKMKENIFKRFFKSKRRVVFIIIILAVGILGWRYFASKRNGEVETAKVEKGVVREELILSGEIKAVEYANLAFQTSGELDFLGIKEGDEVKKGDILAKLDTTNLYQAFLSADADLRRYQASLNKTYDDVQGHVKDESFTQIETRTVAETNKDKAFRAYAIAQQNLINATLKAPFDGIVTSLTYPFTGVNTVFSQPQIELVNPATIYFDVSADQSEVIKFKKEQKVVIVLDSYPDEEYLGTISYISFTPKAGEVGSTYKVKVSFRDLNLHFNEVRVGMSGDAKIILSEKEDALFVPAKFVKSDTKGRYVNFGKKNNKKYVVVGIEGEERVEITGDIKEDDIVYD